MIYKPLNTELGNLPNEKWKDIAGYIGIYQISNAGRIKALPKILRGRYESSRYLPEKILRQNKNAGYYYINLQFRKQGKLLKVHRLVAEAFVPNPHNKKFVNHINCIKSDNRSDNLEWCTHKENCIHSSINGLLANRAKGERIGIAVLLPNQVREIYESKLLQRQLMQKYHVSAGTISNIRTGKIWRHVTQNHIL